MVTAPVTIVLPDGEVYGTSATTDDAPTLIRDTPKRSPLLSVEVPELEGLWSYSSDDGEVVSPNLLQAMFPVIPISTLHQKIRFYKFCFVVSFHTIRLVHKSFH